jgi:PAS domain S-box-containing protein
MSIAVCLTPAAFAQAPLDSALVVFPLRNTASGVVEMEPAIRQVLEHSVGRPIDVHVEYLDITDASTPGYEAKLVELLRDKYAGRPLGVVMADRPEGLRFVLKYRDSVFGGAPVVFTNVRSSTVDALQPGPGVTGILIDTDQRRTFDAAFRLQPDASQVVIVAGASAFDRGNEAAVREAVRATAPHLPVVSLVGLPFAEQLNAVSRLSPDSIVMFASYRVDSLGRSVVSSNLLPQVTAASKAPVYGSVHHWLGLGVVGGDLIRYDVLGTQAATIAKRILDGEAPAAIPVVKQSPIELMFDWRQLHRWNLDESRLPPGSKVEFRELTFFERYRWYVLSFLALAIAQTMLISGLLFERRTRRRAESVVREAEGRYRTIADFNHDWEDWERPDGSFAYVSPSCEQLTGYTAQAFYERPLLIDELVVAEDRARWVEHRQASRSGGSPSGLEFRITTRDGTIRWIDHVCTPVTDNDTFVGVRGSNRDITDRKRREEELNRAVTEIGRLREQLEVDNTYLSEELRLTGDVEGIVGSSDALRYVISKARQVAGTSSTVLLMGETGVGKDIVAVAIHNLSDRRTRPLVRVNCAALPPTLIESELFGHEKGAFTGANAQRKGRFEAAHGSTLFLDEVGELPLELQAKLLRVLQDGEFERVGGNTTIKADVRVISATNRQLQNEVKQGRFREDLWYRLSVFPITMPPLRERRDDIPPLVHHFVAKHCRRLGRPLLDVTKATLRDLQSRDWVGNVRELESVIERAVITSNGGALRLTDEAPIRAEAPPVSTDRPQTLMQVERAHIISMLERTGWRVDGAGGAAVLLGINPSTLRSRMLKLAIYRPGISAPPAQPHA